MPIVSVSKTDLFSRLGKNYTDEEFDELCFEYGIELDDITCEKEMQEKETGKASENASEEVMYKIDIPANRYDLLCIEGLSRSLNIFLGKVSPPKYVITKGPWSITVDASVNNVRPYVVGAILRGISLNKARYTSFIALQDKLHQNICRQRSLVSMGTHDLDTMKSDVVYKALTPDQIKFEALNQPGVKSASELHKVFSAPDSHLKPYLNILDGHPKWPIICDSEGVLSWPPITNSERSKISVDTKNVFIEVTATDAHKASIVLNILVCMFSEYCENQYHVESVDVKEVDGSISTWPKLDPIKFDVKVTAVNSLLGLQLKPSEVGNLLRKMSLIVDGDCSANAQSLTVLAPPTRADVLHACDIVEDCGIAYGYNNLEVVAPPTVCTGRQQPINHLSDLVRECVAQAGYTEGLTFSLCSEADVSSHLNIDAKVALDRAVKIGNPKTADFQIVRTSLLPGLLRTLSANKRMPLPLKVFEISDVVVKSQTSGTGASQHRELCAIFCSTSAAFEKMHGLMDRLSVVLNLKTPDCALKLRGWSCLKDAGKGDHNETLHVSTASQYLEGWSAVIASGSKLVGHIGVLNPDVLGHFGLNAPCTAMQIDFQTLVLPSA